ncbi:MAG TPA: SRPBCC family protein [Candidatus Limnocylindria bacterium]|nr:SRPBCC family protein [Candidatus Limnocylindria bacterium]
MKSEIGIVIRAPLDRVFALGAEIERWPERLPHYRYVRPVADPDGRRRFAMGARRGPIPVAWEAVQVPRPEERRIEFTHTGGVTRGMEVAWILTPLDDGSIDVRIHHELRLGWPVIGGFAADAVIGPQFIEPIARRTLRTIKAIAEAGR